MAEPTTAFINISVEILVGGEDEDEALDFAYTTADGIAESIMVDYNCMAMVNFVELD